MDRYFLQIEFDDEPAYIFDAETSPVHLDEDALITIAPGNADLARRVLACLNSNGAEDTLLDKSKWTGADSVTHAKTTHVVIDYDADAPYPHMPKPGDVILEMVAYDESGTITGSLCNIDFFSDGDDWVTGMFYHLSEIPEKCEHLREVARDLGLEG